MKNKVIITGILYSNLMNDNVTANNKEIPAIRINLFFQFFISSLQSFISIQAVGNPAKSSKA